jgi:hypothetical protein
MKTLTAILLGLTLVACGGGGGGDGSDDGNIDPSNPQLQAALAVLEECIPAPLGTLQGVIDTVRAFPGASEPPLLISDPDGDQIPFNADPATAPVPEILGVFTFRDPAGDPIMPFTAEDLQNDIGNLIDGIAGLPDGTAVDITLFAVPTLGLESGSLTQVIQGGLPTDVSGSFRTVEDTCSVELSFEDETILSLLGQYPNLTALVVVNREADALTGSVFFNGTSTAVVEVSINGTGPFQFEVDLDTGEITPAN